MSSTWLFKAFVYGLVFSMMIKQCYNDVYEPCLPSRRLRQDGDVTIAGLFPIHLYNAGLKRYELNIQAAVWAEAMVFAISEINANKNILENVTIGYSIFDSCNEIETAMKNILGLMMDEVSNRTLSSALVQGNVDADNQNITKHNSRTEEYGTLVSSTEIQHTCSCTTAPTNFISLIGGASSKISESVSNMLNIDMIPQISYSSTSTQLSQKHTYPSFLRTIPPDNFQSQFIIDILKHYGWSYINVLASDDQYGRIGVDHLLPQLESAGICVAVLALCSTASKSSGMFSPNSFNVSLLDPCTESRKVLNLPPVTICP